MSALRTPAGLLVVAAYALALIGAALVVVLLSAPASGVTIRQDGAALRVDIEGGASFNLPADGLVTATGAGRATAFRAKELLPDYTPDGPAVSLRDWYAREAGLASMARQGGVRLTFATARGDRVVVPQPRRRRASDLSADTWLLLGQALGVGLLGSWLLVLKPRDPAARLYAAACAGVAITGLSGALYDGRDLFQGGWWLWLAQAVNLAGTAFCSSTLLGLYLLLPRRLVDPAWAWAPAVFGLAAAGLVAAGVAPLVIWYSGLLATAPAYVIVVLLQWRAARHRPDDRAVLLYLGAVTIAGMGLLSAFMAAPVLFGIPSLMGDGAAAIPVLLVFAGTAFGVRRRRLFELETWAHRLIGGLGWTAAVLLCDAVLVWGLSLTAPEASAIAMVVVSFIYFPLRSQLHQRASGRSRRSDLELFQSSAIVAFTRDANEREKRWRDLLELAYAPLAIEASAVPVETPRLDHDGGQLHLPATSAGPAFTMAHCSGGRRVFSAADLALAGELVEALRRAEAARAEYLRGVAEERQRIAQDLHDDINARLLTSLHRSELTHVRSDVRQAMADIRTMMEGLTGESQSVEQLLADLRFETAERLEAAAMALVWPPPSFEADAILEHAAARSLVAGVRELVSNVVRHSGAESVNVDVRLTPDRILLIFADDGRGMRPHRERDQGGLSNLKNRARRAGGLAEVADSSRGVTVKFSLPVRPKAAGASTRLARTDEPPKEAG